MCLKRTFHLGVRSIASVVGWLDHHYVRDLKENIDSCYTRILWMVLDSKWKDRKKKLVTNADTYGSLQRVSQRLHQDTTTDNVASLLAGTYTDTMNEWDMSWGTQARTDVTQWAREEKLTRTYVDTLRKNTELDCVNYIVMLGLWTTDAFGGLLTAIDARTLQPPEVK